MKYTTRSIGKFIKIGLSLFLLLSAFLGNFSAWAAISSQAASVHPANVAQVATNSPWSMFHNDPQHSGRSPYIGPQLNTLAWTYQTGGDVYSSPAIGNDGTIYVGSVDGNLYALTPEGGLRWTYSTNGAVLSSPALASDGTIYVGSRDHNLYAINPDGTLKWTYLRGGEVNSSPTVWTDGTIYVGSGNGTLYGINPTGALHCSYAAGALIHSSPAISLDGSLYVGISDGRLVALDLNCNPLWQYTLESHHGVWTNPAVSPDGSAVYFGADDGYFWAVDTASGTLKWRSPFTYGGVQSSAAVGSDGTVYVGTQYGYLWALNPVDGTVQWSSYPTLSAWSSPVIGADGTIYFATDYGAIFAMNPDGSSKWSYVGGYDVAGHFHSSPAIGPTGALYIGSTNGRLFAFNTTLVIATPDNIEVYPGDPVSVSLDVQGALNLYALQASCTVDSVVMQPQEATFGNFFDPVNRLITANQVDATSGTWFGAISQRSPALPLSGNGNLAALSYQAIGPGTTTITCDPLLSDRDGFAQPAAYLGASVTVLSFATISGMAAYQGRLSHNEIVVTAAGPVTSVGSTDNTGYYLLNNLKAGNYNITADAPRYLPSCTIVSVASSQALSLSNVVLRGGDTNDDGTINIGDATLLAANFGLVVPPADTRADINADNTVNIRDLAILGGNYELSGCQDW